MWGLPDSAVVGTAKRLKRVAKKSAHKRSPRTVVRTTTRITTKKTTIHRELTVSEWLDLLQHAE
jgi:hypothetical protein